MEKKEYIDEIQKLIEDEKEAVEGYDKMLAKLTKLEKQTPKDAKIISTLNHIRTEELEHITMLEGLIALVNNDDYDEYQEARYYYM